MSRPNTQVLLIADCCLPSPKSSAQMMDDLSREFVRRGHQVTILTPSDAIHGGLDVSREEGLTVVRYKTGKIKTSRRITRAINEMLLSPMAMLRTRRYMRDKTFGLVVFYSPSIFFGPLVARLKKRHQAHTYLILRDIFPDWAVQTGLMSKGIAYRVFKVFERIQYAVADTIGVETSRSQLYFKGTAHESKITLLRNWINPNTPKAAGQSIRKRLGLTDQTGFLDSKVSQSNV